jgi:hypothetical protein
MSPVRLRKSCLLALAILVILSISVAHAQYSQSGSPVAVASSRVVPLTIRIVMLGFASNDLNSSYLTSGIDQIPVKYQQILQGPINTGVMFNFTYQYLYESPSSSIVQSFVTYLTSIGTTKDTTPGQPGFNNLAFARPGSQVTHVHNTFYNATLVESWLSNQTQIGAAPVAGYTLFIADLHNQLPSMKYSDSVAYNTPCSGLCIPNIVPNPHYYNRNVTDVDLGLQQYRYFMTGWGGTGRNYYIDLSAGISNSTGELPIQVAEGARGINPSTQYGKIWASEFINDYISGAVNNVFAADQLYPVSYSQTYNFQLLVFDNRTDLEESRGPLITKTLDTTKVQQQLQALLPFATVKVTANFFNITKYPALAAVVANATTKVKDPILSIPIVDARLVWNWLSTYGQGHITQFINATHTTAEYDIPGFIFAFQGNYTFAFTFKEDIASHQPPGSIGGVALGDMILVNQSEDSLRAGNFSSIYNEPNKGVGFTRAVTHEFGHMMGLNHPFIYDLTEDFTNSVMAYYPESTTFSQFDKDTVLRGINDELLIIAQAALAATSNNLFNAGSVGSARQEMALADQHYSTMDYAGAVPHSLAAALDALQAEAAGSLFSPGLVLGLIGVAVGAAIGIFSSYFFFRKRKSTANAIGYNLCPTCQQPLRWDPVQMKWYCDREQKFV